MSIQWTLIAGVMYVELAMTVFLLLPFISPARWHSFFKSRFLRSIGNMSHIYFKVFLGVLVLFFVDAIREMKKYSYELSDEMKADHAYHLDAEMQAHMRLFRAQRNFYISGFSLFLWVVLQRLVSLISRLSMSMKESEASLKQAQSASAAAQQLLKQDQMSQEEKHEEESQKQVNSTNEIKELKAENRRLEAEKEAALKQAEAVGREYDRLMKELDTQQKKVTILSGNEECKKDD